MISHVIIRYGNDRETLLYAVGGTLLFLPFTIVMMRKFKQMAANRPVTAADANTGGLHDYVSRQYALLRSFYRFKRLYEIIMIPLSTAIGTVLVFQLCVPGGAAAHIAGVIITFVLALLSCAFAIAAENRRHFREPLTRLRQILAEFGDESKGNNQ